MEMCDILIVDDNEQARMTLSDIIEATGHTVAAVATGAEALERARDLQPGIALIDLKLRDMPGLAVIKKLRGISPSTQCVIITGHASQESAIQALNLGVSKYVQKPYDQDKLLEVVHDLVRQSESGVAHIVDKFASHQEEILAAVNQINGYVREHGEILAAQGQWVKSHSDVHVAQDKDFRTLSNRVWVLSGGSGLLAVVAAILQFLNL